MAKCRLLQGRRAEGWEKNPDGTFSMWFGYLNRNYEERLNIAVGRNNGFNGEDMGQAEVFEPRRSRFAFKVVVPANFPKDRDLVWTVTAKRRHAEGVWFALAGVHWRGPGVAKFEPKVVRVVDGKATAKITFDHPSHYVLRAYAEDASIHTPHDVSVTVRPPQ